MSDLLPLLSNGAFEKIQDKSEGHARGKGGKGQERMLFVVFVLRERERAQPFPERDSGIMTPLFLSSIPLCITFTHLFIKLCFFCVCVFLSSFSIKRMAAALDDKCQSKTYAEMC